MVQDPPIRFPTHFCHTCVEDGEINEHDRTTRHETRRRKTNTTLINPILIDPIFNTDEEGRGKGGKGGKLSWLFEGWRWVLLAFYMGICMKDKMDSFQPERAILVINCPLHIIHTFGFILSLLISFSPSQNQKQNSSEHNLTSID
jgi:hypothetical protein